MPYKKSPASFKKHKSNAVGFMAEGSAAYMHGDPDTPHLDPKKEGVTVTGDASKVGGKTVPTEAEKRAEKKKRREEERAISKANLEMKRELAKETAKAKIAQRQTKQQQLKRKIEGKDYQRPDGVVVRRRVAGN